MQTTDEQKIGGIARCQLLYLLTTAGIRAMGGKGQAENAVFRVHFPGQSHARVVATFDSRSFSTVREKFAAKLRNSM